jgi:hypothetical protein
MEKGSNDLTPQEWRAATDYALKLAERMAEASRPETAETSQSRISLARARAIDESSY